MGVLTGFETLSERLRDEVLRKREPLAAFMANLDRLATTDIPLSAYVLYKPDPAMTDGDAWQEAKRSIQFLQMQCSSRDIPLEIRLNPMYRSRGSRWDTVASEIPAYTPPRITDAMALAEEMTAAGVPVYIGLSTEGLADDDGTYRAREDYSPGLIRHIKLFNDRRITQFPTLRTG